MFCQKCGASCTEGERFCSSCGADLTQTSVNSEPQFQQPIQQPQYEQPVQQAPYNQQPQYAQPVQQAPYNQQPQYGQPVQQTQPQFNQPVDHSFQSQPVKKKSKKGLAIGITAAVVVAGGAVGGYFVYQSVAAKQFIENNPTKAVYNSYETYLSKRNESTAGLVSIVSGAMEKGTFALDVNGGIDYEGQKQSVNATILASYDKKSNEYFCKVDGLNSLMGSSLSSSGSQSDGSGSFKFYTNIDKVNFEYNTMGQIGSYYVDMANFRSDMTNSIFSPSKENVLQMSEADFEEAIASFEKLYNSLKNSSTKKNDAIERIIKLLEENGKTEVKEETITVCGASRNVYTITYTFDVESLKKIIVGLKDELLNMVDNSDIKIENVADLKKSLNDTVDKIIKSMDSDSFNKALKVTVQNSLDKDTKEAAKMVVDVENYSNDNRAPVHFAIEFGNDKEINMNVEFSVNDEKGGVVKLSVKSQKNGSITRYDIDFSLNNNTDKDHDKKLNAFLEYDDSAKSYKLGYKLDDEEEKSVSGKANISGNTAEFSYEQKIQMPDYSKLDYSSENFSYDDLPQIDIGSIVYTVKLSSETQMEKFDGEKNLLAMTKDEFANFSNSLSIPGGSSYDYDDDENSYYKFKDDYDASKYKSDAAALDASCKAVYSAVMDGSLTSDDIPGLPAKGASASEFKQAAGKITVGQVIEYQGLDFRNNEPIPDHYDDEDISFIGEYTRLTDIYNQ